MLELYKIQSSCDIDPAPPYFTLKHSPHTLNGWFTAKVRSEVPLSRQHQQQLLRTLTLSTFSHPEGN